MGVDFITGADLVARGVGDMDAIAPVGRRLIPSDVSTDPVTFHVSGATVADVDAVTRKSVNDKR